jgi:hypothetical protein
MHETESICNPNREPNKNCFFHGVKTPKMGRVLRDDFLFVLPPALGASALRTSTV